MQPTISHQPDQSRFITAIDGEMAVLIYKQLDETTLDLRTTFVPVSLRLQGIGERLVKFALEFAREQEYRVIPSCWFVARIIERNPEYKALVAD